MFTWNWFMSEANAPAAVGSPVRGTTAVSLMSSYLKSYYPNVATYIPDRYDEGYGISYKGIDFADDNSFVHREHYKRLFLAPLWTYCTYGRSIDPEAVPRKDPLIVVLSYEEK